MSPSNLDQQMYLKEQDIVDFPEKQDQFCTASSASHRNLNCLFGGIWVCWMRWPRAKCADKHDFQAWAKLLLPDASRTFRGFDSNPFSQTRISEVESPCRVVASSLWVDPDDTKL